MHSAEKEFSLYDLFLPLNNKKVILYLIFIGFAVYFNALFNNFIWDDITYIVYNPDAHAINIGRFFGDNVYNLHGYYRPLQPLYFATLFTLFKFNTFFYHFTQISLQIICTILLYFLFRRFFSILIAFVLSLIFLIHPVQVESVSYIAASGYELFFLFGILATLISTKKTIIRKDIVLIGILLLLSLLTRETAILFFPIILLFQFLYNKKYLILIFFTEIVTGMVYAFIRFGISHITFEKNTLYPIGQLSLTGRMQNIPEIIYYYFKILFFPAKLAIDQIWVITSLTISNFYMPLLLDVVIFSMLVYLGVYLYKKNNKDFKIFVFFTIWFFISFFMLLQFIPLDMTVAERWMYFPIIGLLGIIGLVIRDIKIKNIIFHKTIPYIVVAIVLALSVRTIVRNANWINAEVLYTHDVKIENNYDLENLTGTVLAAEGKYSEALPYLLDSHKQHLGDSNLYNIGSLYEKKQEYAKAKYFYGQVITNKKVSDLRSEVKLNAYIGYGRMGLIDKPEINVTFLHDALQQFPDNGILWSFLSISEYRRHNKKEALQAAQKANRLLKNDSSEKLYDIILHDKKLDLRL